MQGWLVRPGGGVDVGRAPWWREGRGSGDAPGSFGYSGWPYDVDGAGRALVTRG
jgi:hypothetical protein